MKQEIVGQGAAVLIVAAIAVAAIIGIAVWYATRTPAEEKVTIKVSTFSPMGVTYIEKVKPLFENEYPNIEVEAVGMPYPDLYSKQTFSLQKDVGTYDVVFIDWCWIPEWAEAGWVEPVEDIVPAEFEEEASDWIWNHFGYKDHLWALGSSGANAMILAYNEKMMAQAGIDHPPETVSELVEQCLQIKEQGIVEYPLSIGLMATEGLSQAINIIVRAYGGETWELDGTPGFNTEAGRNAVGFLQDAIQEYEIVNPANVELLDHEAWMQLATEDAVFGITWTMYIPPLNDPETSEAAGHINIVTFPATEAGEPAAFPSGMGYALAANSPHPDATKKWLTWNATKEAQRIYLDIMGALAPYPDLYEEKLDTCPWMAQFPEIAEHFKLQSKSLWYAEVSDIWAEEVQNAATGKSVTEALNDCEDRINEVIAGYTD